ncbi:MAG: hypothetical protein Q4F66_09040 [Clostridium sp.]|nr:hypothetical protein [Clostridium sp.]
MNEGQEKFFNFILDNTREECKLQAHGLLVDSFSRQADGTFDSKYLEEFIPKMLELIKPQSIEQVKNILMNYKA